MSGWFYIWLITFVTLGAFVVISNNQWKKALDIAERALDGWQRAEDDFARLLKRDRSGDEWKQ